MNLVNAFTNLTISHRLPRLNDVKKCQSSVYIHDRALLETILGNAQSKWAKQIARKIEKDKRDTIKQLGDTPSDPSPLPFTQFQTEAQAVAGCATPRYAGLLLIGILLTLKPRKLVEIGAAHGYGAAYMGEPLRRLGEGHHLATFEGMAVRCDLARKLISRFGLDDYVDLIEGNFDVTLNQYLRESGPIDFLFSDGDKDADRTYNQFLLGIDAMPDGGHMFFDDIGFDEEIRRVWNEIVAHPRIVACTSFLGRWGLITVQSEINQ